MIYSMHRSSLNIHIGPLEMLKTMPFYSIYERPPVSRKRGTFGHLIISVGLRNKINVTESAEKFKLSIYEQIPWFHKTVFGSKSGLMHDLSCYFPLKLLHLSLQPQQMLHLNLLLNI